VNKIKRLKAEAAIKKMLGEPTLSDKMEELLAK
jgi:hypothetical protein